MSQKNFLRIQKFDWQVSVWSNHYLSHQAPLFYHFENFAKPILLHNKLVTQADSERGTIGPSVPGLCINNPKKGLIFMSSQWILSALQLFTVNHDIYAPLRSSSIHQHSLIFFFFFLYKGEKWQFDLALTDQAISWILSWTLLGHSVGVLNVSCFSYWLTAALGFSTACKQCEQCKQCKQWKQFYSAVLPPSLVVFFLFAVVSGVLVASSGSGNGCWSP